MASNAPNSSSAPETDWRTKSIKEFGLQERPANWSQKAHDKSAGRSNSQQWRKYYDSRTALEKKKQKQKRIEKEGPIEFYDSDEEGPGMDDEVVNAWHSIKELYRNTISSKLCEVSDTVLQRWENGIYLTVHEALIDNDEFRTFQIVVTVFSPWALPRAISMQTYYHFRTRAMSVEFGLRCGFRMKSFVSEAITQNKLSLDGDSMHRGYLERNKDNYDVWETLCCTYFDDPPSIGDDDVDYETWSDVQKIDVDKFTPETVTRLRR